MTAQKGYPKNIVGVIEFNSEEGYEEKVCAEGRPFLSGKVIDQIQTNRVMHPDVKQSISTICVPLESWGRNLGILCLVNERSSNAFQTHDLDFAQTLAAQAAIAINNANIYSELYSLGMQINRVDLDPKQIFEQTVQSLLRVSDAKAANMLLLHNTDNPEFCILQDPVMSVSVGLGKEFNERITVRNDGLTLRVLQERRPLAVSLSEDPESLNPLAIDKGIKSYLCLPMMIQETIIGTLFVHYDKPHVFSKNEIKMLSLFTNQAALAIENKKNREELETAYQTLKQARERVLAAEKLSVMSQVSAEFAHRMNNLAGTIPIRINLAKENLTTATSPDFEKVTRMLDGVANDTRGLLQAAQEIKRATRISTPEKVVVNKEVNNAIKRVLSSQPNIEGRITLNLSFKADLPKIFIDRNKLLDTLVSVIRNGIEAIPVKGTLDVSTGTGLLSGIECIEITVTDSGIGIPFIDLPKIFDLFFTTKKNGLGFGLWWDKNFVMGLGGDIEVVSVEGKGSTFAIKIPLDISEE